MSSRLNIFQNNSDDDVDTQLQQISQALSNTQTWSKKIRNTLSLKVSDNSAQTTTSTTYVTIPNLNQVFNTVTDLVNMDINIGLSSGATTSIQVLIDGVQTQEFTDAVSGQHLVLFTDTMKMAPGRHTLELRWKTSSGTATKGYCNMIINNLI
jgi:hypothetical protein